MSPPSWSQACASIARLYVLQALRSRAIWVVVAVAALPLFAGAVALQAEPDDAWQTVVGVSISLLAIVPGVLSAGVIADELDGQTYTFLWSRPIPRWSVYAGKLAAAGPAAGLIVTAALALGYFVLDSSGAGQLEQAIRGGLAVLAGALACSAVAAGIGTTVPKHPIVSSIVYMLLLDVPIGAVPFDLRNLSITHQVSELSGMGEVGTAPVVSLAWMAGVALLWTAVGLWRLRKLEAAVKD